MLIENIYGKLGLEFKSNNFKIITSTTFKNKETGEEYPKIKDIAFYGRLEECLIGLKKYMIIEGCSDDEVNSLKKLEDLVQNVDETLKDFLIKHEKELKVLR